MVQMQRTSALKARVLSPLGRGVLLWLVMLGQGCSGGNGEVPIATSTSPVVTCAEDGTCQFTMVLPAETHLAQMAIATSGTLSIGDRTRIVSMHGTSTVSSIADAASQGDDFVRLGPEALVSYLQIDQRNLAIEDRARVEGALVRSARFPVRRVSPKAYVSQQTERALPTVSHTLFTVRAPREYSRAVPEDLSKPYDRTEVPGEDLPPMQRVITLTPNDSGTGYGEIKVERGNVLRLTAGTYHAKSLQLLSGSELAVDTTGGVVRLVLDEAPTFDGPVRSIRGADPDDHNSDAVRFLLATRSTGTVTLRHHFEGIVLAPDGTVQVDARRGYPYDGYTVRGAIFARRVEIQPDNVLGVHWSPEVFAIRPESPERTEPPPEPPRPSSSGLPMVRYVPHLGILDGSSCLAWPKDLSVSALANSVAERTDDRFTAVRSLLETMYRREIEKVTTFGSIDELVLGFYDEPEGYEAVRRWVAVNPATHVGYDLSYVHLCTEAHLRPPRGGDSACETKYLAISTDLVDGRRTQETYRVLRLREPYRRRGSTDHEALKTAVLVAPKVRVPAGIERVELDVNLIVASWAFEAASADTQVLVRPYTRTLDTAATWYDDVNDRLRPGLLVVAAEQVKNFSGFYVQDGKRVSRVVLEERSDVETWQRAVPLDAAEKVFGTVAEMHVPIKLGLASSSLIKDARNESEGPVRSSRAPQFWCESYADKHYLTYVVPVDTHQGRSIPDSGPFDRDGDCRFEFAESVQCQVPEAQLGTYLPCAQLTCEGRCFDGIETSTTHLRHELQLQTHARPGWGRYGANGPTAALFAPEPAGGAKVEVGSPATRMLEAAVGPDQLPKPSDYPKVSDARRMLLDVFKDDRLWRNTAARASEMGRIPDQCSVGDWRNTFVGDGIFYPAKLRTGGIPSDPRIRPKCGEDELPQARERRNSSGVVVAYNPTECRPRETLSLDCHDLGDIVLNLDGTESTLATTTIVPTSQRLSIKLLEQLKKQWAEPEGQAPAADVRRQATAEQARVAAQVLSGGQLFDVLYHQADLQSLATGDVSPKYQDLLAVLDSVEPPSDPPQLVPISQQGMVRQLGQPDAASKYNALGMPTGAVSAGWYPKWRPERSSSPPSTFATLDEVGERWQHVGSMAQEFEAAVKAQTDVSKWVQLLQTNKTLSLDIGAFAGSFIDSSETAVADFSKIQAKVTHSVVLLTAKKDALFQDLAQTFDCNGCTTVEQLKTKVDSRIGEIIDRCGKDNLDPLGPLTTILEMMPYVGVACEAAGNIGKAIGEDAIDFAATLKKLENVTAPSGDRWQLAGTVADASTALQKIERTLGSAESAFSALGTMMSQLATVTMQDSGCPIDSPGRGAAEALLASMANTKAIVDVMDTQAQLLTTLLQTVEATSQYFITTKQGAEDLRERSLTLAAGYQSMTDEDLQTLSTRARFIHDACHTVRDAARLAETELYNVSAMLQTTAGAAGTKAKLVVPAGDSWDQQSSSFRHDDEVHFPYVSNVFELTDFARALRWSSPDVNSSFVEQATRRAEAALDYVCAWQAPIGSPVSRTWITVRKTLDRAALDKLATQGYLTFQVGLTDLVEGGNHFTSLNRTAVGMTGFGGSVPADPGLGTLGIPAGPPFVLDVGFAACTGPAADPCSQLGLETGFNSAYLVSMGESLIPSSCGAGETPQLSLQKAMTIAEGAMVQTCLRSTNSPRLLQLVRPMTDADGERLLSNTWLEHDCAAPGGVDHIELKDLRGLPALGSWALTDATFNAVRVMQLGTAHSQGDPEPFVVDPSVQAVQVVFVVGLEARPHGPKVYVTTPASSWSAP